ncbi:MAG: phage tail protein [Aestuariibacter sp.]
MSDAFTGQIQGFGFSFAPRNWALCAGQLVNISQQTTLFSLLGVFFGGDGRTSFGYPNLTSRSAVGFNMGGGIGVTPYQMGTMYGFEDITLTLQQMPVHTHTADFTPAGVAAGITTSVKATTEDGESASPSDGSYLATTVPGPAGPDQPEKIYRNTAPSAGTLVHLGGVSSSGGGSSGGTVNVHNAGGGTSVENRMPFTAINFSICVEGLYPQRN